MKHYLFKTLCAALIAATACLGLTSPAAANSAVCSALDGAVIINAEDEYLGKIASSFSSDSIYNSFGKYGSKFQSDSIWNTFGKNGSEFRTNSAFNEFTRNPPRLIKNGRVVGFLTVRDDISGGIHPLILGMVCYDYKP